MKRTHTCTAQVHPPIGVHCVRVQSIGAFVRHLCGICAVHLCSHPRCPGIPGPHEFAHFVRALVRLSRIASQLADLAAELARGQP